jgi:hypothetical protein
MRPASVCSRTTSGGKLVVNLIVARMSIRQASLAHTDTWLPVKTGLLMRDARASDGGTPLLSLIVFKYHRVGSVISRPTWFERLS